MRKLRGFVVAGALLLGPALAATGASAATEVGNDCEANSLVPDATLLPLANGPSSSLPVTVPAAGVATGWKIELTPSAEGHDEKLKVLRPTGAANKFRVVAESETELAIVGRKAFATRIPVRAGDRFAVYSHTGAPSCQPAGPGDLMGTFNGDAILGSTRLLSEESLAQAAVSALVEPDADRDGYGDETQDECPKNAAHQDACPTVKVKAAAVVRERSILLRVRTGSKALVHVFGQVGWGFRAPPHRAGQRRSGRPTRLIVGLRGGTKTVFPGRATPFRIALGKAVLRRIGRLTPQESLKAKITILATDPAGPVTNRRLTVKLPGQGSS